MTYLAIGALIAGIFSGQYLLSENNNAILSFLSEYLLYILMFSVGISVGMNESIIAKIKNYNLKILLIPLGVIIASVIGGLVCSFILNMDLIHSLAIASSMGWYSLSGVMLESIVNAEVGTIAFFSGLLRELIAFLAIPIIIKIFNPYAAIAAAGATSEDTTLPLLIKHSSEEYVIIAVINGILCSVAVPILINLYFSI